MAVRAALGSSAGQIVRLLMTESVLLAMLGGAAGLVLSWVALRGAPSVVPPGLLPEGMGLRFDARITLFAAALTGLTGALFGLAPAWHAARTSLTQALASGGRSSTRTGTMRKVLAVGEVAGAVLLLSGAGLLVRTLMAMNAEDRGFRADSVLTMSVSLPITRYPTQTQVLAFYRQLEPALAALPAFVWSASATTFRSMDGISASRSKLPVIRRPIPQVVDRRTIKWSARVTSRPSASPY
jgi:putative ABC transport system permease protein